CGFILAHQLSRGLLVAGADVRQKIRKSAGIGHAQTPSRVALLFRPLPYRAYASTPARILRVTVVFVKGTPLRWKRISHLVSWRSPVTGPIPGLSVPLQVVILWTRIFFANSCPVRTLTRNDSFRKGDWHSTNFDPNPFAV